MYYNLFYCLGIGYTKSMFKNVSVKNVNLNSVLYKKNCIKI